MTLYDHGRVQLDVKLLADLRYSLCFVLSAAVGEQDKWDPLVFQEGQGFRGSGERFRGSKEDTVNAGQWVRYSTKQDEEGE